MTLLAGIVLAAMLSLPVPREVCAAVGEFRHDAGSYTQGLFFHNGRLYESAGVYGESSLRMVDLATGRVLRRHNFDRQYFIEGSCICKGRLYVLTWRENTCFVCDTATLEPCRKLAYGGEGWGLTTDGNELIMSDGSSTITFRNPADMAVKRSITVKYEGKEINMLNELEYIEGEIWANVYGTDFILRIDPATGQVKAVLDCTGILPRNLRRPTTDVLNGIAYDSSTKSIYITGKLWPRLYKIK